MIGAGEQQEVAKQIARLTFNHFAVFEHSNELVALNVVVSVDGQFKDLLPNCVIRVVNFAEERKVKSIQQFLRWAAHSVLLAWK